MANVTGMLPCLVTHHTHKVRTMHLKALELGEGLRKDGCPEALLGDLGVIEDRIAALYQTLEGYKGAQENAIAQERAANKARREAEQQARQAARAASKGTPATTPVPVQVATARGPIEITTGPEGVTVTAS